MQGQAGGRARGLVRFTSLLKQNDMLERALAPLALPHRSSQLHARTDGRGQVEITNQIRERGLQEILA